jgi:hypothetical protein
MNIPVGDELGRTLNETEVACFKAIFKNLPVRTEETHEKHVGLRIENQTRDLPNTKWK